MSLICDPLADLLACLRFYSRLPVPVFACEASPHAMLDFPRAVRMLPIAGVIIAAISAAALVTAAELGLPGFVSASLALAVGVLTTGAFHEDGLADTADGFGGGVTRQAKLDIMRDSRIGTYGGAALALSFLIRWSALGAMAQNDIWDAAAAIVACGAVSRTFALLPLALLPPARREGAAWAAARPRAPALTTAFGLASFIGLLPVIAGAPFLLALAAMASALVASLIVTHISRRQIGGQTGDIAGAAQQIAEIAYLCVFSARV